MRKRAIAASVLVGIVPLILTATFTPTLEYDPRMGSTPDIVRRVAQEVEDFLWRSGRLPPPDTPLVLRSGRLEWETVPESAKQIANITARRVWLTSGAPLLMSVLDDDPTFGVKVDVTVTTADGQETTLRVELWDYGLLTPWALHSEGDGLKPGRVSMY